MWVCCAIGHGRTYARGAIRASGGGEKASTCPDFFLLLFGIVAPGPPNCFCLQASKATSNRVSLRSSNSRLVSSRRVLVCAAADKTTTDKVRTIIADQLGSDIEEVRKEGNAETRGSQWIRLYSLFNSKQGEGEREWSCTAQIAPFDAIAQPILVQVTPEAKFVDLGADSLDTVEIM